MACRRPPPPAPSSRRRRPRRPPPPAPVSRRRPHPPRGRRPGPPPPRAGRRRGSQRTPKRTAAEPAPFDLECRVPAGNQVVSVGRLVSERVLGPQSVSEWKTDGPIRVAGFNYGKFKQLARRDGDTGVDLEVYTNPGTPDIIHTI